MQENEQGEHMPLLSGPAAEQQLGAPPDRGADPDALLLDPAALLLPDADPPLPGGATAALREYLDLLSGAGDQDAVDRGLLLLLLAFADRWQRAAPPRGTPRDVVAALPRVPTAAGPATVESPAEGAAIAGAAEAVAATADADPVGPESGVGSADPQGDASSSLAAVPCFSDPLGVAAAAAASAAAAPPPDSVCPCCLEETAVAVRFPCGHCACEPCTQRWLEGHDTCVMCRAPVCQQQGLTASAAAAAAAGSGILGAEATNATNAVGDEAITLAAGDALALQSLPEGIEALVRRLLGPRAPPLGGRDSESGGGGGEAAIGELDSGGRYEIGGGGAGAGGLLRRDVTPEQAAQSEAARARLRSMRESLHHMQARGALYHKWLGRMH